jgi:large subunit ribosomal protein L21
MEKYAVIKSGGHQYLVTEGQTLLIDKLVAANKTIDFDQILLVKDAGKVEIGMPHVSGVVTATVLGEEKGKKIRVSKYKAKTGYRKSIGFRSQLTRVKINSISLEKKKVVKE